MTRLLTASLVLLLACADGDTATDDNTDATTTVVSDWVDRKCLDGQWSELPPDPAGDISDLISSFDTLGAVPFLEGVLDVRYPVGTYLIEGGLASDGVGGTNCVRAFTSESDRSSASGMLSSASTLVHECGHFYDIGLGGFTDAGYAITEEVTLTCSGGSYNDVFARSRILSDPFAAARPPCPAQGSHGCDSYANIYLDGDPDNASFEGGDQGFDSVLEETVQYVNSLATDYALADRIGANSAVSARDGILTFLWYLERYLHTARTEYPNDYNALISKACWREVTLTTWGRAWMMLKASEGDASLGLDDDDLMELVTDPLLLEEIRRVRDAEGC